MHRLMQRINSKKKISSNIPTKSQLSQSSSRRSTTRYGKTPPWASHPHSLTICTSHLSNSFPMQPPYIKPQLSTCPKTGKPASIAEKFRAPILCFRWAPRTTDNTSQDRRRKKVFTHVRTAHSTYRLNLLPSETRFPRIIRTSDARLGEAQRIDCATSSIQKLQYHAAGPC
jgi:hypothetical protein